MLGPGALFGELPFFDGEPRSSDARALTPVLLGEIAYEAVRTVIDEHPSLLWDVTLILTRRLRNTDEALADAMFLDVTGRTAKRLLQIAGRDDEFSLPVTQEELAAMVGASRERVNKAIATFVRLGWLALPARTRYRILNREELEGTDARLMVAPATSRAPRLVGSDGQVSIARMKRPAAASPLLNASRADRVRAEERRSAGQLILSQATARVQSASASSARCVGRSGSCTKP